MHHALGQGHLCLLDRARQVAWLALGQEALLDLLFLPLLVILALDGGRERSLLLAATFIIKLLLLDLPGFWLHNLAAADHEARVRRRAQVEVIAQLSLGLQLVIVPLDRGHSAFGDFLAPVETRECDQREKENADADLESVVQVELQLVKVLHQRLLDHVERDDKLVFERRAGLHWLLRLHLLSSVACWLEDVIGR